MERVFELVLLASTAFAAVRIMCMPAAIRELRDHPIAGSLVVLLGFGAVAIVAWAARFSPLSLRVVSIAALITAGLAMWWSHPRFGKKRGLPPGSLGITDSLNAIVNRSFYADRFARYGPVFKMSQFHNRVVCIQSLAQGRELLKQQASSLALPAMTVSAVSPKGFLRYMAPDDYAKYAPLFRAAFTEDVLSASIGFARDTARRSLTELSSTAGKPDEGGVDPRPALQEFLFATLMWIYFGDLIDSEDHQRIEDWCREIGATSTRGRIRPATREAAVDFENLLRRRGGEAAAGTVWANILQLDPAAGSDRTTTANLLMLIEASRDSIAGLLIWSLKNLADHPEWLVAIRGEPGDDSESGGGPDMIATGVILETLRLAQSEYVYRTCARPIEVDGFQIPKGWFLRICVAEAHRTTPPFQDPDAFQPSRHTAARFSSKHFAPFGLDRHACLGARMSLFVGQEFVRVLAREFDIRSTSDGEPERGNRHWLHWEPSRRFRVHVMPR